MNRKISLSNRAFLAVALCIGLFAGLAAAQVEDYRDIVYPQLEEFEIQRPETFELENGLKVFLIEDHELPLIQATARIRTGSVYEPAEKTGLAGLTGAIQRTGGTRSMSGDELDDFLEARAASVETNIGNSVGFASMDCLKEDFEEVFAVFHDVLRYPEFAEDKMEIAKARAKTGIARRNDNIGSITGREFSRLVYGYDSPLSRMTEYETVDAVSREDLRAWHTKYYQPNNIYLGVVGDFDSKKMKKKIQEIFGGWPEGASFDEPPVDYEKERRPGVYYIEKTDVTQANIRVGHLGTLVADDPDYFALQVMNEILGGGFSGRLLRYVRTDKGLAYSAFGGVNAGFAYPAVAGFGLQTKSESMAQAVEATFEVLRGMRTDPVTADELSRAKETILNSFVFNYASTGQVLGQQMLYSYYGLPADFLERYRANIEKVTQDDVMRVAAKYLHPDEMTLLVVGKSEDFDRPVETFGEVQVVDITIPSPEVEMAAVEKTAESEAAGRVVLASVVAALGEPEGERAEALRQVEEMEISMQGQTMSLTQESIIVYPDRIWASLQTPMGQQVVVIDGGEGFMAMGGQSRPTPAEQVERQLEDLGHDLQYVLRYSDSEDLEVIAAGEEDLEGTPCKILALTFGKEPSRWWVDSGGRVLKAVFQSQHPFTGTPGQFEVFFSDYREIDGRLVPHRVVTHVDGNQLMSSTVQTYEVNPAVDPALFEKPAA